MSSQWAGIEPGQVRQPVSLDLGWQSVRRIVDRIVFGLGVALTLVGLGALLRR